MPILTVELTDTLDQWRQKDNQMIAQINALSVAGDVILSNTPVSGQVLVYDGTFFRNVTMSGDATISSSGSVTVTGGGSTSRGRIRFIGSMTSLY